MTRELETMRSKLEKPEDALLIVEGEMSAAELIPFGAGQSAVVSMRAPHKDNLNEDALALIPYDEGRGVLAVADGAGGMPGAHHASRTALEALQASLKRGCKEKLPLREAILRGIDFANSSVSSMGIGAATTLAVVALEENQVRAYHVGDSPVLVVGGKGKLKLLTISHSPVGYAVESGLIDEEDAMHHVDRHLISNCLGMPSMRVEMSSPIELRPRDTLLVASDGLYDNIHTHEIVEQLHKGPLLESFQAMVDEARRRMTTQEEGIPSKPDDLTLVAYRP